MGSKEIKSIEDALKEVGEFAIAEAKLLDNADYKNSATNLLFGCAIELICRYFPKNKRLEILDILYEGGKFAIQLSLKKDDKSEE